VRSWQNILAEQMIIDVHPTLSNIQLLLDIDQKGKGKHKQVKTICSPRPAFLWKGGLSEAAGAYELLHQARKTIGISSDQVITFLNAISNHSVRVLWNLAGWSRQITTKVQKQLTFVPVSKELPTMQDASATRHGNCLGLRRPADLGPKQILTSQYHLD
jgi:hypothetical protein